MGKRKPFTLARKRGQSTGGQGKKNTFHTARKRGQSTGGQGREKKKVRGKNKTNTTKTHGRPKKKEGKIMKTMGPTRKKKGATGLGRQNERGKACKTRH